jgi:hypothetical protein
MSSTSYIEHIKLFSSATAAVVGVSLSLTVPLKLSNTTEMIVLVGSVVAKQLTDKASRTVDAVMGSEVHTTEAVSSIQALTKAAVLT